MSSTNPLPPLSPESAKLIAELCAAESWCAKAGHHEPDLSERAQRALAARAALEQHIRELERELARMREQHALCYEASRNIGRAAFYEFNRYVNERSQAINAKYAAPTERDG